MLAKGTYDRVAEKYDQDWSGIYSQARAHCVEQITDQLAIQRHPPESVDLGIGTGNAFRDLGREIELGQCVGFDLSREMLALARGKLNGNVRLIRADALEAPRFLSPGSQDLVLCHFILSFMDTRRLLKTAFDLLRPGGIVSLATSTQRSLIEMHSGRFSRSGKLLGVKELLHKVNTPTDHRQCLKTLEAQGFEILDDRLHRQSVSFASFQDVHDWAVDSGWVVSALDDYLGMRQTVGRVVFTLGKVFLHPLYPIEAVNEVSVVLARKPLEDG